MLQEWLYRFCAAVPHGVSSLWPELPQRLRQQMFNIFNLSLTDVARKNFENGTHHLLGINRVIVAKDSRDVI